MNRKTLTPAPLVGAGPNTTFIFIPTKGTSMKPQLRFLFAGGAIAALSAAVTYAVAGPPAGSPVQRTITYEGNLTDTQGALQATYPMQFSLWDSESNPTGKLWESTSTNIAVEQTTGRFIAVLGPAIGPELPDNVYETPSLWLGATIDAIPMPRQRIAAVPFAVRAEKAEVAGRITFSGSSGRISIGEPCGVSSIVSGKMGGFPTVLSNCRTACGSEQSHMCTHFETSLAIQRGYALPAGVDQAWISGFPADNRSAETNLIASLRSEVSDCRGWTSFSVIEGAQEYTPWGTIISRNSYGMDIATKACDQSAPILCCQ